MNELEPQPEEQENPPMRLTDDMQYYLFEAAKWAKRIGIAGFVFAALFVFSALGIRSGAMSNAQLSQVPGGAAMLSGTYLIFAAITVVLSVMLYQFGGQVKDGVTYSSEERVTLGLARIRSFFRTWGIMIAAMLVLSVLSVFSGIAAMIK